MNKKEAIEAIKKRREYPVDFTCAIIRIPAVLDIIKEIDETEKVSIPQFVADWIEQCKNYATLFECLKGEYGLIRTEYASEEFKLWITDNDNNEGVIARAWLDGYEVEKEPLYEVVFLIDNDDKDRYLLMEMGERHYEVVSETENDGYQKQQFTESEIKAIDERFWAFAVPVQADES